MKVTALIEVYGIVQGVGMRYSVFRKAKALGIKGYVRNRPDGSVEIVAEGYKDNIEKLIDYIRNGIRWARVDDIIVHWDDYKARYNSFDIKY